MARYTYGSTNVAYSTFDEWANNLPVADSNISASSAFGDFHPAITSDYEASFLQGSSIFYGSFVAGTGGTVELTAPYTVTATSSFNIKNINVTNTSITAVASTSYPWVFDSWRTAAGGGGSSISTNATLTITDAAIADHTTYYAYFTTTHIDP